jgi:hypothetical protein
MRRRNRANYEPKAVPVKEVAGLTDNRHGGGSRSGMERLYLSNPPFIAIPPKKEIFTNDHTCETFL